MRINIITALNGVGLERDANILKEVLAPFHKVEVIDLNKPRVKRADANIFCEILKPNFIKLAKVNYFLPNPEWFMPHWSHLLPKVTTIAKTQSAAREFEAQHIGFTSKDFYTDRPKVRRFVHFSGKSSYKGTEQLIQAWKPEYPTLYIKRDRNKLKVDKPNIVYSYERIPEPQYVDFFSESLIHLCPSIAEGWGHYIHEAKSAGNVVITTDGEPMNEFTNDFLVKSDKSEPLQRGIKYTPSIESIQAQVERVIKMTDAELEQIGNKNRLEYLANDKEFKKKLIELFT